MSNVGVCAPKGFVASGISAGIKASGKRDLSIVYSNSLASAAGVFTTNLVKAAPVIISQQRVANGKGQAVVFSSGNANAATGERGLMVANAMTEEAANLLDCAVDNIFIAQTGLIGIQLNKEVVVAGVKEAVSALSVDGGQAAAEGIMTTDTCAKFSSKKVELDGVEVTVGIMAKGVAMLAPSMATMLSIVTTDADVEPTVLKTLLQEAVADSFHLVSVDGCQSTNDTVFILANGQSGSSRIDDTAKESYQLLKGAVASLCKQMAIAMAKDAEGAKKLITSNVTGAETKEDARKAALQVVGSVLVKCAVAGECGYWGRVIAELGASGAKFDPNKVQIAFGDIVNCKNGTLHEHDSKKLSAYMKGEHIVINSDLGAGDQSATAYGSDLTHEYVKINMEKS